ITTKGGCPMSAEKPITLTRDCPAVMVPRGDPVSLSAGSSVWLTQALGGTYTVMTERGYTARIDGHDADALGLTPPDDRQTADAGPASIEDRVWHELRSCFDPAIPVNLVGLGFVSA